MYVADGTSSLRLTLLRRSGAFAVIEVDASAGEGSWKAVDEALERREVRWLVRWLRDIGKGRDPKELGFTEPNLRFECLSNGDAAKLRIWFEGELRPPWRPWQQESDCWIDLTVGREQVVHAAAELAAELERIER
jgi:hypothetical protein